MQPKFFFQKPTNNSNSVKQTTLGSMMDSLQARPENILQEAQLSLKRTVFDMFNL